MKRDLKKKMVVMSAGFAFILLCLQACNMNPPSVAQQQVTGTLPTFTPTPCWTVGNNTVYATNSGTLGGSIFWYPVVPNANKSLTHMALYVSSAVPVTYQLGIYYNNVSVPSFPGGQTGPVTSGPVTGWLQAPLSYTFAASSGTTYWLAIHSSNQNYQSGLPASIYGYQNSIASFGTMPSATPTMSNGFAFSYYGTACP